VPVYLASTSLELEYVLKLAKKAKEHLNVEIKQNKQLDSLLESVNTLFITC